MKRNKHLNIQQSDKGKKTIIIETEIVGKLAMHFMEKRFTKSYIFQKVQQKQKATSKGNQEAALLRKKVLSWREKGIFKIRNQKNMGKEKEYWDKINSVQDIIPTMRFIIKAHKPNELKIRNLCPKTELGHTS